LSYYDFGEIPEARFLYDLSSITLMQKLKKCIFFSYNTSIIAIIRGTFTILGLVEQFCGFVNK